MRLKGFYLRGRPPSDRLDSFFLFLGLLSSQLSSCFLLGPEGVDFAFHAAKSTPTVSPHHDQYSRHLETSLSVNRRVLAEAPDSTPSHRLRARPPCTYERKIPRNRWSESLGHPGQSKIYAPNEEGALHWLDIAGWCRISNLNVLISANRLLGPPHAQASATNNGTDSGVALIHHQAHNETISETYPFKSTTRGKAPTLH